MTKKDYELIATAFKQDLGFLVERYPFYASERTDKRKSFDTALNHGIQTARRLATALELDNPKFDRVRFLEACGMTKNQLAQYAEIPKFFEYDAYSNI